MLAHVLVDGGEARAAAHVLAVDTGRGAALDFLLQQPVHEVEAERVAAAEGGGRDWVAGPARGLAAGGLDPDAAEVEQHAARETCPDIDARKH